MAATRMVGDTDGVYREQLLEGVTRPGKGVRPTRHPCSWFWCLLTRPHTQMCTKFSTYSSGKAVHTWNSQTTLPLNWIKLKSLSEVCVPGKHMSLLIWFGQLITSYELELLFKNFFQFASWMIYKLIWLMLTWLLSCLPWHVCLLLLLLL